MTRCADILEFWFDRMPPEGPLPPQRLKLWFGGESSTDRAIRERFEGDLDPALSGAYDDWSISPRGRLALIVLLDQIPRNIYRDQARAYAFDERALEVALEGLKRGEDRALTIVERAFFYLPLEHAEELDLQERSVAAFARLLKEAPPALHQSCAGFLDYARRHRDIIARFGRYPHRNRALGRPSTTEEIEFLKEPGSSF